MKKILFIVVILLIAISSNLVATAQSAQKIYKTQNGKISFFSETPLENIDANSSTMASAINPANRTIACVIVINSFKFKNSLMQEHFNEKYMESDKYPKSTFSGVINEAVDLMKPGTYDVTVTGKLVIHGVEQTRTIKGTITVDASNKLTLQSDFDVKLVDHKIEVPEIVFHKIAEVIKVKVNSEYSLQ